MADQEAEFLQKLGRQVQRLRLARNLTQEAMEETRNGVPYRTIQQVEEAKAAMSVRTLYRIAKRLGVKPRDILDFE
ncbi:MAG: helix-turn-helix domain-containing protein [Leptospirales bacterium]|nr:helix-turn-helix domain-containing protein [Leptospirales bacterium]